VRLQYDFKKTEVLFTLSSKFIKNSKKEAEVLIDMLFGDRRI
jgi:hypothetical protein